MEKLVILFGLMIQNFFFKQTAYFSVMLCGVLVL